MIDETLHKRMVEGLLTQSEGQKFSARIAELEAENERLRDALAFYADPATYTRIIYEEDFGPVTGPVTSPEKLAREVLASVAKQGRVITEEELRPVIVDEAIREQCIRLIEHHAEANWLEAIKQESNPDPKQRNGCWEAYRALTELASTIRAIPANKEDE